jgi:hypothetical protein
MENNNCDSMQNFFERKREAVNHHENNEDAVTVVVTACGRPDLLEITLKSFLKYNTYPISQFIISEDSGIPDINKKLELEYPHFRWINAPQRRGQIKSIDEAYSYVNTPYIFHLEDDWETFRPGVIEESLIILKSGDKISAVMCRQHGEGGYYLDEDSVTKTPYLRCDRPPWGYFGGHYGNFIKIEFNRRDPSRCESIINDTYKNLGYRMAMTRDPIGYCRDIGMYRHVF